MLEYNSSRTDIILKEYGRNVQKLANYLSTIEDGEERTRYAYTLIELMRQLNPSVKENNETTQKLWDDLFIMTNFTLDVDAPYPSPEVDILTKKPDRVPYSTEPVRYRHYGKNLEKLVQQAGELEDAEEKKAATIYLGKLMKTFYGTWNRENIDDEIILRDMKKMSRGKLSISEEEVKEKGLFEINQPKTRNNNNNNNNKGRRNNHRRKR
ncbi:DUF4290 domain-containing protein [Tunicatimonas pelagia]|uniref:DUF4290 domain-containing protein n=1 Tax=Tunicatimonas pelagia TaxID=931531 RepID=UPI002666D909|nr:DUF4290 domain-containing protein [Tunicatimonas pelagia]WKN45167.1 DUF4290 domain-containing protein [Tunicatimonas pelagia]